MNLRQTKIRSILLYTWSISYILILISYCALINDTITIDRALGLFAKTSAVVLPQLMVIISFFYSKSEDEIEEIVLSSQFAPFAFISSFLFIVIYTLLIIIGIPFHSLFDWKIEECTDNLLKIMGNVLFFSTGAITYLFSKRPNHQNGS